MMRTALVFLFLTCLSRFASAQENQVQAHQIWMAGIGAGASMGVNEDLSRPIVFQLRIEGIAYNGVTPGVSPEFGVTFLTLRSTMTGASTDYRTQMIAPDLRFRFSPFTTMAWFPYVDIGVGVVAYHVLDVPSASAPNAQLSDATLFIPMGIGLFHQLSDDIGVDLNIGGYPSIGDDLNPVHDGRPDGWWSGLMSLHYIF
jgi:hypothetical protein